MSSLSRLATSATLAVLAISAVSGPANATLVQINDKATFLANTGATSATGPIPIDGANLTSLTVGTVTFSNVGTNSLNFEMDWTSRIAGNQFAINEFEDLDVDFGGDIFAFGFDFVEPEHDPLVNATFFDSLFEVSVCNGFVCFDNIQFNAPNDMAFFVGVTSTSAFDSVKIRELIGGVGNEFFGEFYTAGAPVSNIPLPAAAPLFLTGLAAIGFASRRRKRV